MNLEQALVRIEELVSDKEKPPYRTIDRCRAGGGTNLVSVLSLGEQELTGVFPKPGESVTKGPLELVWCPDSGLLQLRHTYNASEMYGDNYGYRSGLNNSMVQHLQAKAIQLTKLANLREDDVALDIGSNDGTLFGAYPLHTRIGIDPTGEKFRSFYREGIILVPEFFSADTYMKASGGKKAKLVTSIAMFYDLADPVEFAREVASIMTDDGIWHLEQSYMPSMLRMTAYDTICHEHLEYYSLTSLIRILNRAGLYLIDVTMNSINGGSFAVTVTKPGNGREDNTSVIAWLLEQEQRMGLDTPEPFRRFERRVYDHRQDLTRLVHALRSDGKTIVGYGASTKGNVLLQFCGFGPDEIACIAEVNEDKYGRVTPGTHIPIVSEAEARAMKPDYFLVLPWHFKAGIVQREREYLAGGGHMIFPFPEIEIV